MANGPGTFFRADESGRVRSITRQRRQPVPAAGAAAGLAPVNPRDVAEAFLLESLPTLALEGEVSLALHAAPAFAATDEQAELRFDREIRLRSQATVTYAQTLFGLPVFEAGVSVRMRGDDLQVTGLQNTVHYELAPPDELDGDYSPPNLDADLLRAKSLPALTGGQLELHSARLTIHRYRADDRGNAFATREEAAASLHRQGIPWIPLGEPDAVHGRHYAVSEVLFSWGPREEWEPLNWQALIDVRSGQVLHLGALTACVDGHVYMTDPPTAGNALVQPTSPAADLDALRQSVMLQGLTSSSPQDLRGRWVVVRDVGPPSIDPPEVVSPNQFSYTVRSDDFAAVNAYYHCHRLFGLLDGMGFDVATYFNGTTFPVTVDHRGSFTNDPSSAETANAFAPGNASNTGSNGFRFMRVQTNTEVGMATHWRVVLHEFGHAILYGFLQWPNFWFAHSAGDALAAILNDPDSQATDRGLTFPWTPIPRRHDRAPSSGFAWGGRMDSSTRVGVPFTPDSAGYQREQILSSTWFRYYRAIGGDHATPEVRRSASRYAVYLIFAAVASMTRSTQPKSAEDFADLLIESDIGTDQFEGMPGGVTHKVIRWAFEQQGLYQSDGAPTPVTGPGAPPAVDVYVDDDRVGHYEPRTGFVQETEDIWNRRNDDGLPDHEDAAAGATNFLYVRIRNRGTDPATPVRVRIFRPLDAPERWPEGWEELDELPADSIDAGESVVAGPLAWQPAGPEDQGFLVAVETPDDESNADMVAGSVATEVLAHCDNNISTRWIRVSQA